LVFLRILTYFYCVALLCLVAGCAPKAAPVWRYFWPPPPDEPKIEYLGPYASDSDLRRGHESWIEDVIVGYGAPTPLFSQPHDVVSDGTGRVLVADVGLRRVVVLDLKTRKVRYLLGDAARDWLMYRTPFSLALDGRGGVYVSDMSQGMVFYFDKDEKIRFAFGKGELERITGMVVDPVRNRIYLVDAPRSVIAIYSLAGEKIDEWGKRGAGAGEFNFPLDVDLDEEGNVYVLDALNFRVQVFSPQGAFLRQFGRIGRQIGGFQLPKGLAVDTSGHVYVTDSRSHRMLIFDLEGQLLQVIGGYGVLTSEGVSPGAFNMPSGIDADQHDGIWVTDTLNLSIQRYQFLNEQFLSEHPVLDEEKYAPSGDDYYIPGPDLEQIR